MMTRTNSVYSLPTVAQICSETAGGKPRVERPANLLEIQNAPETKQGLQKEKILEQENKPRFLRDVYVA